MPIKFLSMDNELIELIKAVAKNNQVTAVVIGRAINVTDTLCNVERDGAPELIDVRLNALEEAQDNYTTIVPEEGSYVLAGVIENDRKEAFVALCSKPEKVIWKIGDHKFEYSAAGAVFNDGTVGLLKLLPVLSAINALQNDINSLKTQLQLWSPTGTLGDIMTLSGLLASWKAVMLTVTQRSQVEDTKIKHS